MENSIFIYKLTTDNGGAPCVKNGLLSLCICKPRIRQSAKKGDWIIGMGGKSVADLKGRLIYIAEVTDVIDNGAYYKMDRYTNRPDCIYRWENSQYRWKSNAMYHSAQDLSHDLGVAPDYERAVCLTSDNFLYFGNNSEPSIEFIRDIYDEVPRDYKVNHDEEVRRRLWQFIERNKRDFGSGKPGNPTHKDNRRKCNTETDDDGIAQYSK